MIALLPDLGRALRCEAVRIYLFDDAEKRLRPGPSWTRPGSAAAVFDPEPVDPAAWFGSAAAPRRRMPRSEGAFLLDRAPLISSGRYEGAVVCHWARAQASAHAGRAIVRDLAPELALVLRCLRLEEESQSSGRRLAELVRLSVDLLAADDLQTIAIQLCEATREIFGVTRSALFLLDGGDLVPHAIAGPYGERAGLGQLHLPPSAEPAFEESLRTGQVLAINDFARSRYGPTPFPVPFRPQAAMTIPLVDGAGTLGILTASELEEPWRFVSRDATDGRLLGAIATGAVRKGLLLADLQRASSAKSEFLASVSHELRTPLNVFLGYLEMLGDEAFGPVTADQRDTLERMSQTVLTQLTLVDDLLDIARIEQGKLAVRSEPFFVSELVDLLRGTMSTLLRGRPIEFVVEVPASLEVRSDRDRLRQVLVNLLSNAAKFTTEGTIAFRAAHWDGGVELIVADTGSGIDVAVQGRETEPFVAGATPGAGAGLGLAIVARILRVLEAGFTIESSVGRGTTARIRLSSEAPDRPSASPDREQPAPRDS